MKAQDVFVQFEERDSSQALHTLGGSSSYMYTITDLKKILSYCKSMMGKPMLDSFIILQHNPVLELRAGSRNSISKAELTAIILDSLMQRYDLHYIVSLTETIDVIRVISVSQKIRYTQNSGTNIDTEGFLTLDNMDFCYFSTFFKTNGLILTTSDEDIRIRGLTFAIPNKLVGTMAENRDEIIRLLDENGIHTEIIKEPVVYLTDEARSKN